MKNKYSKLFDKIKSENSVHEPNDRVLIVDGANTFLRAHAASQLVSEAGIHMGGVTGFLTSVGYAIKNINPTRVIVIFDGKGGSIARKKLFPNYKLKRQSKVNVTNNKIYDSVDEEQKSIKFQIIKLITYLDQLPLNYVAYDYIEADDTIAYITKILLSRNEKTRCFIMSADRDFLQLVNDRTTVYSPTKKIFYTPEKLYEEIGIPPENYIWVKCLQGDGSDNIPGIRGFGLKTIIKRLPFLTKYNDKISIDEIFNYVTGLDENEQKYKVYKTLLENRKQFDINYKLMQLHDIDISASTKGKILSFIDKPINRMVKHIFIKKLVEDSLHMFIKAPDVWLKTHWWKLDIFAALTH